jgi:hypothetical protein
LGDRREAFLLEGLRIESDLIAVKAKYKLVIKSILSFWVEFIKEV